MSSSDAESRPSPRKRLRIAASSDPSDADLNPSSSSSPRRLAHAASSLAGSSRGLATNGAAERARAAHPAARGRAAAASGAVAFAGEVSISEPEPTTEEGSADELVLPFQPGATSSRAIAGPSGSRSKQPTPVVELGNSSSSDDDLYAPPGPSTSRQPFTTSTDLTRRMGQTAKAVSDDDDDDDIVVVTEGSTANGRDKGKGKARAKSTTPASASTSAKTNGTTSPRTQPAPNGNADEAATVAATAGPPPGSPPRTLAMLECPICCGPPTPLALTSCGHTFCAPCLHAALVAGPPLTPPPAGAGGPSTARRGGPLGMDTARLFLPGTRGAAALGGGGRSGGESEDEGDPDLNKRCPLCRTPLTGGWGKSLRGLVLRMAPKKR